MTRFARSSPPAGHVHLQFVGNVPGVPAAELGPGDRLMWNGGGTSTVVSVRDASAQFIEIVEAWQHAVTGQTEWTPRRLKKTRLIARVPVENWTAGDRRPMFGRADRVYLRAVRIAGPESIAPWRTGVCPKCGQAPPGADAIGAGGQVVATGDGQAHVVIGGAVVLGCEGFRVVDPAAVGLDRNMWADWRKVIGLQDADQVVVTVAGSAAVPVHPVTDAKLDATHYAGYADDLAMLRKVGMDRPEDYELGDDS